MLVSLFEEDDAISLLRHSFVNTSTGSAICTVTAGETTPVTIEMSLPEMCGWRLEMGNGFPLVPYYAVNNCGMAYHINRAYGDSYNFGILTPAVKENCSCIVTVTVDGESVQSGHDLKYHDEEKIASIDFSVNGTELASQKIAAAVEAEKAFTVKVWVSADEQYTLIVPPHFVEMCKEIDAADDGLEDYQFSNSVFMATTENCNAAIILFKDNPRLVVFQLDEHGEFQTYTADETADGTQSALDWIDLEKLRIPGEFMFYSQFSGCDELSQ